MAEKENGKGIILVTGAAGFIGRALCEHLLDEGCRVRALVRRNGRRLPPETTARLEGLVEIDDLAGSCSWEEIVGGVESVVHLAGRAHSGAADDDLFFRHNLDAAVALARAACRFQVRRFIFCSSIKVNGEALSEGRLSQRPYTASDPPRPQGPYAVSKWRAEQELSRIFPSRGEILLTIIRPPLVYGPGAAGNLAGLKRWLELGLPLPVPREGNRRSLIDRGRLLEVITECLACPQPERLLLPCDPKVRSTADIARLLAGDSRICLLPVPGFWLKLGFRLVGRPEIYYKLYGDLQIAG
jgi:nucleoside-diphosphate-sugar epimerase